MVLILNNEILGFFCPLCTFCQSCRKFIYMMNSLKLIGEFLWLFLTVLVNTAILVWQITCAVIKTEVDSTNVSENLSVLLLAEYPLGHGVSPLNFILVAINRVAERKIAMQTTAVSCLNHKHTRRHSGIPYLQATTIILSYKSHMNKTLLFLIRPSTTFCKPPFQISHYINEA